MRVDALEQAMRPRLADADEADAVAEGGGLRDVGGKDVADAADRDIVKRRLRAEGDRGEDRQLVRGIDAVDVEAGIRLRISQRLCLGEHLGKVAALRLHLGQDEIAGAVEDAVDVADDVGRRTFAQALDDRDAAGHRRLELEWHAGPFGLLCQFQPVMGEHRLVRGDEAAPGGKRVAGQRQRRTVRSADQFDHHIGLSMGGECGGVVDPVETRQIDAAILGPVAGGYRDDLDRAARAPGNQVAIGVQQANDTAPYRAKTCQCHP